MRFNRSIKIVRGGCVNSTVHTKHDPTEEDIDELVQLYGAITPALLTRLQSRFGDVKNNAEFDDLNTQIRIVTFTLQHRGTVTLVQPKVTPAEERFKTLSELFYGTFCGDLRPKSGPRAKARPDYLYYAKPYIRKLAANGGTKYDHAIASLKMAYVGESSAEQELAYHDAVQAVIPPLK